VCVLFHSFRQKSYCTHTRTRTNAHAHTFVRTLLCDTVVDHRLDHCCRFGHWPLYIIIQYNIIISTRVFSTALLHLPSLAGRANNNITRFHLPSRSSLRPSVTPSLSLSPPRRFFSSRFTEFATTAGYYNNIIIHIYYYYEQRVHRCRQRPTATTGRQ